MPGKYGPRPQRLEQVARAGWPVPRGDAPEAAPFQEVTVFYSPEDPSRAVVAGWERRYASWYLAPALLFGAGGAVLAVQTRRYEAVKRRARGIARAPGDAADPPARA